MNQLLRTFSSRLLAITLTAVLWGCGGSGGDDLVASINVPPAEDPVATVTLLLTDAPSDDFDEILVTISSIELLGNGDPFVLFEGLETVDLLRLENFSDLFAVSDSVPAGSYEKIRLRVDDIELIKLDDMGLVTESIRPDLPANGKIDLNPQDSINVQAADNIVLQLDIDARRSIHITGSGNGSYKFRPVIFVKTLDQDFDGKAVRINGDILAIDEVNTTFDICQSHPSSADSDSDSDSDALMDDDSDEDECVTVNTNEETGFFNGDAQSAAFADLMPGDTVLVIGDYTGNENAMFDATVVAINSDLVFAQYEGVIQSAVDANNRFDLLLDSGQGFTTDTTIVVDVQPGTGIADDDGNTLDTSIIQPDIEAEIDGLIVLSDTDPDVLRAVYIALDIDSDDDDMDEEDEIMVSGTVLSVDETTDSLMLATPDGDRCIVLDDNADIFRISTVDDVTTTQAISLTEVAVNAAADIYGEERNDGCVEASTILVL